MFFIIYLYRVEVTILKSTFLKNKVLLKIGEFYIAGKSAITGKSAFAGKEAIARKSENECMFHLECLILI